MLRLTANISKKKDQERVSSLSQRKIERDNSTKSLKIKNKVDIEPRTESF